MCYSQLRLLSGAVTLIALFFSSPYFLSARSSALVELDQVRFESLRDNWLRMEIRIRANHNPLAANPRFVSSVRLTLFLSFKKNDGNFDFYESSAEIVSLEENRLTRVYFYFPGIIMKRDALREPFAYLVEVEAEGHAQQLGARSISSNIRGNPQAISSFKKRAEVEGKRNNGILRPAYLGPAIVEELVDMREIPVYRRVEAED